MRILLVEDDQALSDGLVQALTAQGFVVNALASGKQAVTAARSGDCDTVVLA